MEEEHQDDIPMMDAPEPAPNASLNPSSTQRFSILDVLGGEEAGGSGRASAAKEMVVSAPLDPMHSEMYEFDENQVLMRLQELYPHTDIQKLPRYWSKHDRWTPPVPNNNGANQLPVLEISTDFLRVTKRKGNSQNSKDAAAVRANRPISRSCIVYYFEITVVSKGTDGYMGIGLSEKSVSLNRLPGWDPTSYGYHGDDGNFFASSGKGVEYGPTFTTGDVIGCGLNFVTREIFFSKNGQHLGIANAQPIPLVNDLYPTIGMQTADEMIDANFGQKPFKFDVRSQIKAAEMATMKGVFTIELPEEKVLWMNNLVSNWMAHEGYSRALDALNRATGGNKLEPAMALAKSDSQGSTMTSASKDSQSPTAAAEKVADTVMRSMIGLLGGGGVEAIAGVARRSVVRSVQEALHEEMEQRRGLVRMVKRGELAQAIDRIEKLYPSLLESNRQLALLLKTQQFVEMLKEISRELPPLLQEQDQFTSQSHHFTHSPSPRPSSSRGGKRSASAILEEEDAIAGTSTDRGASGNQHNPVKRRSSDEECQEQQQPHIRQHHLLPRQQQNAQNGNAALAQGQQPQQQSAHQLQDEFMEISEESQESQSAGATTTIMMMDEQMANGRSTNGCSSANVLLVGTPPTSTTIIDEPPVAEIFEMATDGMEMGDEQRELDECGGFECVEEQNQFERYATVLEFGHHISQLSLKMDMDDGQQPQPSQSCGILKQRMNDVFALLCYRDPSQSVHAYLLDQSQRDMVAKALNAAILESHGKEGISPLDRCLRRARFIRDQALACSASAVFADANQLLFGENPAASPNHPGTETTTKPAGNLQGSSQQDTGEGAQGKTTSRVIQSSTDGQQKKRM